MRVVYSIMLVLRVVRIGYLNVPDEYRIQA